MKKAILVFIIIAVIACSNQTENNNGTLSAPRETIDEVQDHPLTMENKHITLVESKDVSISGMDKGNGMIGPITVSVGEKSQTFDWVNVSNPTYFPELSLSDLNHDQEYEIYIVLTTGYGTGIRESMFIY